MNNNKEYIAAILYKRLQGEDLSGDEQMVLDQWLSTAKINESVLEQLQDSAGLKSYLEQRMDLVNAGKAFEAFEKMIAAESLPSTAHEPTRSHIYFLSRRRWAAAAVIFLLTAAGYLLFRYNNNSGHQSDKAYQHAIADIKPGKQGAILTLSNGRQVVLDSLGNGLVATQSGVNVLLKDGELAYAKDGETTAGVAFNTVTTPKGRKFQLLLPDGTKVWLDAASSLTFPTVFTGGERSVSIKGEAYFEVAKNAAMPFKVVVNDRTGIDVLGTSFNINAYTEEASMNMTLLDGSIRVTNSQEKIVLRPGQQASVRHNDPASSGISVKTADIDKVMAWKNDLFDFEGATLAEVMNQVSRWYDMEVIYEGGIPAFTFGGKIRQDLTLTGLLAFLEGAGVHFRVEEGRRLIVMP
jgi:ferric-dicitrate binding protein FerR (iron transport regulator)